MMTERVPTGIPGFDELVQGGLTEGSVNICSGPAGSAKTTIGMQFVYNGAKEGENGLFLTLEESRDNIITAMKNFDMDLEPLLNKLGLLVPKPIRANTSPVRRK